MLRAWNINDSCIIDRNKTLFLFFFLSLSLSHSFLWPTDISASYHADFPRILAVIDRGIFWIIINAERTPFNACHLDNGTTPFKKHSARLRFNHSVRIAFHVTSQPVSGHRMKRHDFLQCINDKYLRKFPETDGIMLDLDDKKGDHLKPLFRFDVQPTVQMFLTQTIIVIVNVNDTSNFLNFHFRFQFRPERKYIYIYIKYFNLRVSQS